MSDQQQQIPVQDSQEPSEAGKRAQVLLDDLESKQLETLDEAGKSIIERIATFLGVLFAITVLSNNFPPPYLKGNTSAKIFIIASLTCFLLAIGAGIWATQVRFYRRYTYNVTRNEKEIKRLVRHKVLWIRVANLLFALGALALAALLIVIVWNL